MLICLWSQLYFDYVLWIFGMLICRLQVIHWHKLQSFTNGKERNFTLFWQSILQCNAIEMAFLNPNIFDMKVIIFDWNIRFNVQWCKIRMFTIMVYFILQETLLLFNNKKERKPYSRYWFLTKISTACLWKCLVICWLLYSLFWFLFYLSYLCVIISNMTCLIIVILTNSSFFISRMLKSFVPLPPPTPNSVYVTSVLLCVVDFGFQRTVYLN